MMEDATSNRNALNLEMSLSPLWRLTYYTGFTFDWCRRIPHQSRLLVPLRYIIILFSLIFQLQFLCFTSMELYQAIKQKKEFSKIVEYVSLLSDQPLILFVWFTFLVYRPEIQVFFQDWGNMVEEYHPFKGANAKKIKQTYFIVYSFYVIYGIVYFIKSCVTSSEHLILVMNDYQTLVNVGYLYPDPIMSYLKIFWITFQLPFYYLLYIIFSSLADIVPAIVYNHAANIVEEMKSKVQEIYTLSNSNNDSSSQQISKSSLVYALWCRFDALTAMVERGDKIFGKTVILCQGILFSNICITVYFSLQVIINPSVNVNELYSLVFDFVFYVSRLIFTIYFMSQLHGFSSALLSSVFIFSKQRQYPLDKEERQITRSFIDRLKHTELAASPSNLYKVKSSVYLTLLSLIITYSIILLQTTDGQKKYYDSKNTTNSSST